MEELFRQLSDKDLDAVVNERWQDVSNIGLEILSGTPRPTPGFFGAAKKGSRESTIGGAEALAFTAAPTAEREQEMLKRALEQQGTSWEDVKKAYADYGINAGFGSLWDFAKELAGGSLAAMAPGIVGAKAAMAIAPPVAPIVGPLAKPAAGVAGFIAGMLPGEYNRMLQSQVVEREAARQAGAPVSELEFGQAGVAALGSSALNIAPLAATGILSLGRRAAGTAVDQTALQAMRQKLVQEGIWSSIAKGTGIAAATEVPTEVAQTALERWQAGETLDPRDPDAWRDYEASIAGALVLSPAFGPAGRRMEVGRAREEVQQQEASAAAEQAAQQQAAQAEQVRPIPTTAQQTLEGFASPAAKEATSAEQAMAWAQQQADERSAQGGRAVQPEDVLRETRINVNNSIQQLEAQRDRLQQSGQMDRAADTQAQIIALREQYAALGGLYKGAAKKVKDALKKAQTDLDKLDTKFKEATDPAALPSILDQMKAKREEVARLNSELELSRDVEPVAKGQMALDFGAEPARVAAPKPTVALPEPYVVSRRAAPAAPEFELGVSMPRVGPTIPESVITRDTLVRDWKLPATAARGRLGETLIGKDLSKGEDVQAVRDTLSAYANRTKAPGVGTIIENLPLMQERAKATQEQLALELEGGMTAEERAQADAAYEVFLEEDARKRASRTQRPITPQDAVELRAQRDARWAEYDDEERAQRETLFNQMATQRMEESAPGTQFELALTGGEGAAPAVAPPRGKILNDYAAEWVAAREAGDVEATNRIDAEARAEYGRAWSALKGNITRRQGVLDFTGAQREAEPVSVRRDVPVREEAGAVGQAGDGGVGMVVEPAAGTPAEGITTPAPGALGGAGPAAAGRVDAEQATTEALTPPPEGVENAVQVESAAKVPVRPGAGGRQKVGRQVRGAGEAAREGEAEAQAEAKAEAQGADEKARQKVTKSLEERIADLDARIADELDPAKAARLTQQRELLDKQLRAQEIGRKVVTPQEELEAVAADREGVDIEAAVSEEPVSPVKPDTVAATQGWAAAPEAPVVAPAAEVIQAVTGINGTEEQLKTAQALAAGIGGEVAFQDGDLALVRGYSVLTGDPVYAGVKGKLRTKIDIARFTGSLFTEQEKARLLAAKAAAESAAADAHATRPFLKFSESKPLLFSPGVAPKTRGVLAGWVNLLKLDGQRIYITTLEDAKANRNKFTGPHRAIGSGTLGANESGSMRMMPDGSFYVIFDGAIPTVAALEVMAHELGHVHERVVYRNAPDEMKQALQTEHRAWLAEQKGKTARELVNALRARVTAERTTVPDNLTADQLTSYWRSFGEWYADQTARWATTQEKPLTVVEKFFKALAESLRSFFRRVQNQGYLPNKTFLQYLETVDRPRGPVEVDTKAEQAVSVAQGAATPSAAQAEAIYASLGRTHAAEQQLTLPQQISNVAAKYTPSAALGKRLYDKVMQALDVSYGLEEARRAAAMMKSLPDRANDAIKDGLITQVGHRQAMSLYALENGGVQLSPTGAMFITPESSAFQGQAGATVQDIRDTIAGMQKAHKLTDQQAIDYANLALESRRMLGLHDWRDGELARAAALEVSTNKSRRAEGKKLREKLEAMVMHMDRAQAEEGIKLFGTLPEIKKVEQLKNDIRQWVADFMVQSGVWSREEADILLENADWVPFRREFSEEEMLNRDSFLAHANIGPKVQYTRNDFRFKGSERPVANILENFENWAAASISNGIRNATTASLTKDAIRDGYAREVNKRTDENRARVVTYIENGKQKLVEYDTEVQAAMFNSGLASPAVNKVIGFFNNIFRNSIIALPTFSAKQLFVDTQEAMVRTGLPPQHAIKIGKYTAEAMARFLKGEESVSFKELRSRGLAGAATDLAVLRGEELRAATGIDRQPKAPKNGKLGEMHRKAVNAGLRGAMYSDNAVREGIYLAALDSGLSKDEASKLAGDYINFRRTVGSNTLASIAAYVPFFSASLAATRASLTALGNKSLSSSARTDALKRYAQNAAVLAALSVLLAAANSEDEAYENMSVEQRARQLTIPGTGGFGIPRRVTLDMLLPIAAELAYNQAAGSAKDVTAVKTAARGMLGEILFPVPEPVPAPIKVVLEQVSNYNSFTGAPIVGPQMAKREAYLQYNESTSELAKAAGEASAALGMSDTISPQRVDHIVRGLFGSAGGIALMFFNGAATVVGDRPTPTLRDALTSVPGFTFPAAKEFNNADKNDLYDLMKRVEKVTTTANKLKAEGRGEDYITYVQENKQLKQFEGQLLRVRNQLSNLRKEITRITASDMPNDQKQGEIRRLREIEMRYIKSLNVKGMREQAGL